MSGIGSYLEEFELPSRGLYYGGKVPGGKVTLQPWGMREQKLMAAARSLQDPLTDLLVDRALVDFPLPTAELLTADAHALLMFARVISHGPIYYYDWTCDECGTLHGKTQIDLYADFIRPNTVYASPDTHPEPYEVQLPGMGKTLGLRYLRRRDQESLRAYADQLRARGMIGPNEGDPLYIPGLARKVMTIDGEPAKLSQAIRLIESIRGPDTRALNRGITKHEFGLRHELQHTCRKCRWRGKRTLPFQGEFLVPGGDEDLEGSARGAARSDADRYRDLMGDGGDDARVGTGDDLADPGRAAGAESVSVHEQIAKELEAAS